MFRQFSHVTVCSLMDEQPPLIRFRSHSDSDQNKPPPSLPTANSSPQWSLTPWPLLEQFVKNFTPTTVGTSDEIARWFDHNLNALTSPIVAVTPKKKAISMVKIMVEPRHYN